MEEAKRVYVEAYIKAIDNGKNEQSAKKEAKNAVKKAGWYLENGKWMNIKTDKKKSKPSSYTNRKDEDIALSKVRVSSRMA